MDLQKESIVCETCGRERVCFIIPDGRIICPRCSPKAVYQRWEEEWREYSKVLAKEEKRLRKEEERARRAEEKQLEKESKLQEAQKLPKPQSVGEGEREEKWNDLYGAMEDEPPEFFPEEFLHWRKTVKNLDTGWLRFTEMAMAVSCVLAFFSGVFYLFQSFRTGLSPVLAASPGTGESALALGAFILKVLPILIGLLSVWGLYQISKLLRQMVDGLGEFLEEKGP